VSSIVDQGRYRVTWSLLDFDVYNHINSTIEHSKIRHLNIAQLNSDSRFNSGCPHRDTHATTELPLQSVVCADSA
jgi:hypothetical protein